MKRMYDHLIRYSPFAIQHSRRRRALTLVELLIVIIIIGILVSSILVASSGFINKGRANNTQAVLQIVADAVEAFKREQTAKPTITRAKQDKPSNVGDPLKDKVFFPDRYGLYPPDELEVFTQLGIPGSQAPPDSRTLAPGGALIVPAPSWQPMRFYKDGDLAKDPVENRDQAAMIVAIETLSETALAILDRIPDRNRNAGALNDKGEPALFLDRLDPATGAPNNTWDPNDHQIHLIVDDWGMPISYFAQRDWKERSAGFNPILSSNHPDWNEASTEFIRMNGGQPIIMSYGPNGKDQFTQEAMGADAKASLVGDFEVGDDHVINDPLNDDNVYSNPGLKEKLNKGIEP